MKLLASIFFLLVFAVVAQAGPQFIQQSTGTDASGTVTGNFDSITTSGSTIIALISHTSVTTVDTVIADDGDSNLAFVNSRSVAGVTTEIWWINNSDGNSPNWQVALTGIGVVNVNFSEWSGIKTANAEATNGNTGTASSTVTTGSVAAVSSSSLVIAIGGWNLGNFAGGPINGFTALIHVLNTGVLQEGAYLINSGTSSKSTGWSLTSGNNWAATIAVFGGTGPSPSQVSAGFFMSP